MYLRAPGGADPPSMGMIEGFASRGDEFLAKAQRRTGQRPFLAAAHYNEECSTPAYLLFDLIVHKPIHNTLHALCRAMAGEIPLAFKPAFHLSIRVPARSAPAG